MAPNSPAPSFLSFYDFSPRPNGIKAETELLTSVVWGYYGKPSLCCLGAMTPVPAKLDAGLQVSPLFTSPACLLMK